MRPLATYRNARPYDFCPGCSHGLVLDALDRALVRLQWNPADIVIVSDIGCVGLSDQYFATSGFHGLHGRSLTYATGIKLARPDLHIINLIGDGGCGIGCAHLVSAARRNIGVTTLVCNNLNFGMTGGEQSVTTPFQQTTTTTPWGNTERPLDIAQTVAANGATFVWRGTAFDPDLDQQIEAALIHDGFALLDIWELCVAYYAAANRMTPRALVTAMEALGFERGAGVGCVPRVEGARALREAWASWQDAGVLAPRSLDVQFSSSLDRTLSLMIAGAAGSHVRTAGHLIGIAATLSGLWTVQRDDYPVTVRAGHSISEVLIAPGTLPYGGGTRPDVLFVLAEEGFKKVSDVIGQMTDADWIFVVPDLVDEVTDRVRKGPVATHLRLLNPDALRGVARSSRALAAVAAGLVYLGILSPEALTEGAGKLGASYAQVNQEAVRAALRAIDALICAVPSA
jgi:2-oxoglutarate/2-oxoacid ferredoxin oxidoreductase subunit beta